MHSKQKKQESFVPVHFSDHVREGVLFAEIGLATNVTVKLFQKVEAAYFKGLLS